MRVRHDGVTQIHGSCRAESIRRVSLIGVIGQLRFSSQQPERTGCSTMGSVLDEAWRTVRGAATPASVARPRCLHRFRSTSVMGEVRHAGLAATNPVSGCWAPHGIHGLARPSLHSGQGLTGTRPRSATRMRSPHARPTSAVNGSTPSDSTCGSIACHARQTSSYCPQFLRTGWMSPDSPETNDRPARESTMQNRQVECLSRRPARASTRR